MEFVSYKAFGAKGDGKTDDLAAIIAAHEYANEHHLPVKADEDAVYYIGDADAPSAGQQTPCSRFRAYMPRHQPSERTGNG